MKIVELKRQNEYEQKLVYTHCSWPTGEPTCLPFELDRFLNRLIKDRPDLACIPFSYVTVWDDNYTLIKICVRTDEYPLMWIYWWVVIRIHKTGEVLEQASKYIFRIWAKL